MAWRIHDSVVRGEIDNRQKGFVRGKVWLDGIAEPVVLELTGNACADLAGSFLKFTNPQPTIPMPKDALFALLQRGSIGDLTASRKVRVFDIPFEEAYAMLKKGGKPPEHMANCLYLEWFSEANGRVVIESADFQLEVSPPEWRMDSKDEEERSGQAVAGWKSFLGKLTQAVEQHERTAKDPEEEKWDEHDYEKMLRESDARTDKYMELLDKYGDSEEAEDKIAQEMGWTRELTDEEAEAERERIEELNAACDAAANEPPPEPDPAREGIDWIRTKDGEIKHPLEHRAFEAAMNYWRKCKRDLEKDDDVGEFVFQLQTTGAKLAGALGPVSEAPDTVDGAFTVACLKRALDHLHKSQAALEVSAKKKNKTGKSPLLAETLVVEARRELFEIREQILALMQRFRQE